LTAAEPDTRAAMGAKYTATANLLIVPARKADPVEFECYKATQQQLMRSPFVLTAALQDGAVRGMPSVRREDERHNALRWLVQRIRVGFPEKNGAVMAVSITAADPEEAAALVNAVVRAYMHEIVDPELTQRTIRLDQLQQLYADRENVARNGRAQLKEVEERLGISGAEDVKIRQQFAVEKRLDSWKELAASKRDLRRARGELKVQKALKEDTKRQEAQVQILEEIVQECQKEADQYAKEADQIGRTSTDVEMQRAELKRLDQTLTAIAEERQRLEVEFQSAPRVKVLGNPEHPAEVPGSAD